MEKYRELFRDIINDPLVRRRLYGITLAAALFALVLAVRGPEQQGKLVVDNNGRAVAISRNSLESSEKYDVELTVAGGEGGVGSITREITLTVRAIGENTASGRVSGEDDAEIREAQINAEIDRMVTDIEYSDEKEIPLPDRLEDGTRIAWKPGRQEDRTGIVIIPVIWMVLSALVIKSWIDSNDDGEDAARREILRGLPRFCNQLFLMMNAGMILSDAFERICDSYAEYGEENMSVFERELTEIARSNREHRISTASLLNEYAALHNVKEMIRIATILTENEKRGSDVVESLSRESKYLWDDRKIVARESGKLIDTRMSWPLAALLIVLIVITISPALMNM